MRTGHEQEKLRALSLPKIYSWEIRGGTVCVKCSPVHRINIITGGFANAGAEFVADTDEDFVTSARWNLRGDEQYVKAVCIDRNGHVAESRIIYLN